MNDVVEDPRCPECGGAIGATATYCMHCSADLTEEQEQADTDDDGYWNDSGVERSSVANDPSSNDGSLLNPDGIVDNTLTTVVGIGGGLLIGATITVVLLVLTSSSWALVVSVPAWLFATNRLVGQETVQEAISKTAYGVAVALISVPFIAFGPSSEGTELVDRIVVFVMMFGGFAILSVIVAGIGYAVSRFTTDDEKAK